MTALLIVPLVSGAAMILLAIWLFRVQAAHEAARVFGFVLVARGASLFALTAMMGAHSVEVVRLASGLYLSLCLATAFGILYFIGVYPTRRLRLPTGSIAPISLFVLLLALVLGAVLEPGVVVPEAPLPGTGPANLVRWLAANPRRPLGIAQTLLDLTMALPAVILLRDYLKATPGKRRDTLLIVSLGFFAPAACSCLIAAATQQFLGVMPTPENPSVFNYVEIAIFGVWFAVLVGLLGYLAVQARHLRGRELRQIGLFGLVVVVSTLIGGSAGLIRDPAISAVAITAMLGFWSGIGAALVVYGILRYSLFDIDLKLKASIRRSTVAAAFVAVYFLVSEVGTVWFADVSGSDYWGIAAAALLLLVLHPIQSLAERLADGLMPGAGPLSELEPDARAAFYREHVDLMWMDGHLSPKDRIVLANLRARLGLDPNVAEAIELEVLEAQQQVASGDS